MKTHLWAIAAGAVRLAAGRAHRDAGLKLSDVDEPGIATCIDANNAEALACSSASSTSTAARRTSTASGRSARCSARSSTRSGSRPSGWTARRGIARAIWSRRTPGAAPKILLIGHLDTVFETDSPFQQFERIDADHARGPGHHRHEGRRRHHAPGAEGAEGRRRARRHERHRRDDRRRRDAGPAAVRGARGAGRRREGRGRGDRLRGRRRRSGARRGRAARHDGLAARGDGHDRPLVADLSARTSAPARSTRPRGSSNAFRDEAGGRAAPDVQPGRVSRRHVGGLRRGAVARHRLRQDERRRRNTRRWPAICAR